MKRAFTLIELLVVMGIVVIMALVAMPTLKALSKNNGAAGAANLVRSYMSNARSIAIAQRRQCGVVFFEETAANFPDAHTGQTAMQLIVEDFDQKKYNTPNTVFVYYSKERQYLPAGVSLSTLDDNSAQAITTGGEAAGTKRSRVVVFSSDGQLALNSGIGCPDPAGAPVDYYPKAYADWKLVPPNTFDLDPSPPFATPIPSHLSRSSPAFILYNKTDYLAEGFNSTAASQAAASNWIRQNSSIIVVNSITGGIIR